MANSDKRQAALDAVQDILKARLASAMGQAGMPEMPGMGGEIDLDIDLSFDDFDFDFLNEQKPNRRTNRERTKRKCKN